MRKVDALILPTVAWLLAAGLLPAGAEKMKRQAVACKAKETLDFLDRMKKEGGEEHYRGILRFALADGNCIVLSPNDEYKRISPLDADGLVQIKDCCSGRTRWIRAKSLK